LTGLPGVLNFFPKYLEKPVFPPPPPVRQIAQEVEPGLMLAKNFPHGVFPPSFFEEGGWSS
jgi:hypothetical protein